MSNKSQTLAEFLIDELKEYIELDGTAHDHTNADYREGEESFKLKSLQPLPFGLATFVARFYQALGFQTTRSDFLGHVQVEEDGIIIRNVVITDVGNSIRVSVKRAL